MSSLLLGFKGLGKGPSADIQPRCTWSSHLSPRRIFLFVSLPSLLATRGPSERRFKTGRRKWDSPVQHEPHVQTHLTRTQPVSSGRLSAEVRWRKVQRENGHFIAFFKIFLKVIFFSQQVLLKHLLPHLSNLLRLQASLQPGRRTQRRLPVSWLKGGEKPDSSGRERSRSVCKERRRTGKKRVDPTRSPQKHKHYVRLDVARHITTRDMFRRCREEMERRRTEERARQQAEAQRLIEEKMRREEEEQRQAEEERAQALREAALLQQQVQTQVIQTA